MAGKWFNVKLNCYSKHAVIDGPIVFSINVILKYAN